MGVDQEGGFEIDGIGSREGEGEERVCFKGGTLIVRRGDSELSVALSDVTFKDDTRSTLFFAFPFLVTCLL